MGVLESALEDVQRRKEEGVSRERNGRMGVLKIKRGDVPPDASGGGGGNALVATT